MGKARSNLIFLTSYKKPGEASFKKYTCRHRCMIGKEAGTSLPGGRIRAEHVGGPLGESDLCLLKFEGHFIQPELCLSLRSLEETGGLEQSLQQGREGGLQWIKCTSASDRRHMLTFFFIAPLTCRAWVI